MNQTINADAMELSMDAMEIVTGGVDPVQTAAAAGAGALVGGTSGTVLGVCLGLASGPVGWIALGGAFLGGAAYATYYAVTSK